MDKKAIIDQDAPTATGEYENRELVESPVSSEVTTTPKTKRRRVGATRKKPGNEQGATVSELEGTGNVSVGTPPRTTGSRGRGRGRRPRLASAIGPDRGSSDAPRRGTGQRGARTAGAQRHSRGGRTAGTAVGGSSRTAASISDTTAEVPEQGSFSQFVLISNEADQLVGALANDPVSLETIDEAESADRLENWLFPECGQLFANSTAPSEQVQHEFRSFRELTNEQFELLTEAQKERYIEFRRAALRPQNLRRFINGLVGGTSGYAPGHPFLVALQGLGKMFIGDLVETAVQVKCEWDRNRQIAEYGEILLGHSIGPDGALQTPLEPRHLREAYRRLQRQGHLFSVLYAGHEQAAGHASTQHPNGFLAI